MLDKNDVLFVVAMKDETGDFFKDLDLIHVGVGKVNAAYHLTKEITERKLKNKPPKYIVNFGSVGSKKFHKGQLVKLGETPAEKQIPMIIEFPKFINDLEYGVCGSGDNFATSQSPIKEVEVSDMEAYAMAKVCYFEKIPFICIKYITDGLDEKGASDWDKEIVDAPHSFKEYVYEHLLKK